MELELQHKSLDGFQLLLDRALSQEETAEGIVPDVCPDIARVVDVRGQVFLTSKEASSGSVRMKGQVNAEVIYIPDGEEGPRSFRLELPFSCAFDDPGLNGDCKIWAKPRLNDMDARTINPRKVLLRAEVFIGLRVYAPEEQQICCSASGGEELGLQMKNEEREICIVSSVNEKGISFSDVFALPASRPNATELLSSRVEHKGMDAKMIGGKLVVKGEAELIMLYRTQEGTAATARFDLPYSQVMELAGAGESCEVEADAMVTGLDCSLQSGEPASVAVTVEMLIHASAFEKKKLNLLTDLYAISCSVEPEWENIPLCSAMENRSKRTGMRRFCESGIPAGTVIDSVLHIGRVTAELGPEGMICRTDTAVTVMFLSEDGALCSATYPIPTELTIPELREGTTGWCCRGIGDVIAVPVTGGIEVRFEVEFSSLAPMRESGRYVGSVRVMPMPEGGGDRPSVILRTVGSGESLWDIAKAYQSTAADIAAANELEDEQIPAGTMLLIPRRR